MQSNYVRFLVEGLLSSLVCVVGKCAGPRWLALWCGSVIGHRHCCLVPAPWWFHRQFLQGCFVVRSLIVGMLRIVRLCWGGPVWNCMRLLVGEELTGVL